MLAALTLAVVLDLSTTGTAVASAWLVRLNTGSSGQSRTQAAPAAPASVTAACNTSPSHSVKLTWPTVAHATTYSVEQSTSAATGPYTVAATVTTATWTSASLAAGSYWYEVSSVIGSHWSGPYSTASTKRTISSGLVCS